MKITNKKSTQISNRSLIIITTILVLFNLSISASNFKFSIKPKDEFCLHEYFPDQTLITVHIFSDKASALSVYIQDSNKKKIAAKKNIHQFKDSFTTIEGGNYEICMLNISKEYNNIEFEMKHGIEAKDYSQIPKLQDLKPIELNLQKLEDYTQEIYHLIMFSDSREKTYGSLQESIIVGISWVSIIIIIIMLLVGVGEAYVGRQIVMSKKIK